MKIRLCEHNKGAGKIFKKLKKELPDQNIKLKDCIKKCGLCHKAPFALVDGKPVGAIDAEDLISKIRKLVKKD